jgi:hypothetical protein
MGEAERAGSNRSAALRDSSVKRVRVPLGRDERVSVAGDGLDELDSEPAATRRDTHVCRRSWKR